MGTKIQLRRWLHAISALQLGFYEQCDAQLPVLWLRRRGYKNSISPMFASLGFPHASIKYVDLGRAQSQLHVAMNYASYTSFLLSVHILKLAYEFNKGLRMISRPTNFIGPRCRYSFHTYDKVAMTVELVDVVLYVWRSILLTQGKRALD